ncbi:MAG TPA: ATP-binding cassette domain-containing protein [Planctomycetota bacterium]|nr:ATP-binding cassette domain-containing protein [Planctomycetota bacterium]
MAESLWTLSEVVLDGTGAARLCATRLEIRPGITAVLGPSGAGKTSLLNLLVQFEAPDAGRVSCAIERGSHSLPVYWVPQSGGLWSHLSVREHLEQVLPADPEGIGEDVGKVLSALDLQHRVDAFPDELSRGEQSRLSVARALVADAAVLVMDEPLAHVDVTQARRYWDVIREHVTARRSSLVFATHSAKTVLAQAGHVVCLREGRLLYSGELGELYHNPPTRELAECLGEANWLTPEEAKLWFDVTRDAPFCLRPEQVSVIPTGRDGSSEIVVAESRFEGSIAEVTVEHASTGLRPSKDFGPQAGRRRSLYHRPSDDRLRPGMPVLLKVLLVLLLVVASGCGTRDEPTIAMSEVRYWSMPPEGAMLPAPRALAVMPGGDVLALDTAGRVLVFDPTGSLRRRWFMPEYAVGRPEGVLVLAPGPGHADGRIAVCDTHYRRVILFNLEGKLVGQFGREGTGPGEFIYPVGLAQDDKGNLYVSEYGSNDRVQKFTLDAAGGAEFVLSFGSFGTGEDQFQRPSGIAWHDGKVYVADAINNRIQVFTDDGKFLGRLADAQHPWSLHYPYDVVFADDALWVVEYGAGRVTKIAPDGKLLGRFGTTGTGERCFRTPWGLAVTPENVVLVADTGNRRIVELRPFGLAQGDPEPRRKGRP